MSDLYMYTPEVCDGDYCPMSCDHCYKRDQVLEWEESMTHENETEREENQT